MEFQLTFDAMPYIAAALTILAYFWPQFENKAQDVKQWVMLGFLFVFIAGAAAGSYLGLWDVYTFSTWQELVQPALTDFFIGLLTMVGVYQPTKYIGAKLSAKLPWMKPKE